MRRVQRAAVWAVLAVGLLVTAGLTHVLQGGEPSPYAVPAPGGARPPAPDLAYPRAVSPAPAPSAAPAPSPFAAPAAEEPVARPAYSAPVAAAPAEMGGSDAGPGVTEQNPTGRQEPAVSLEWIGPPAAKVGQPADYAVVVRNACRIAVQQVLVRVRLPETVNVSGTEPKALQEGQVLMWDVGTLMPQQEKQLQLKIVASARGDVPCQAWVTFTGSSAMRIRVREPKLLLKATAPEKALVGDGATFLLTVSNPGDHPAEQVKIHSELTEGLEHARGPKVDFDIGNLAPGETRSVQVICTAKGGGEQKCSAVAEAEGGLKAADAAGVNVIVPRIDLEVVSAPKLRYLDRPAQYIFKVTNPGDAPAANVMLSDSVPAGFKYVGSSGGGRHDFSTRTVSWFLGEIPPGQSREVKLDLVAVNPGEHHHKLTAQASRGLRAEAETVTRVEGLSAILLELVDVEDPVEVNAETAYEIRVTNTGSKTETDVKLACTLPDQLQFKGAVAPAGLQWQVNGNEVVFDVLPKLAPRADVIYRVNVKAIGAGVVQFKTKLTSTNLIDPVHKDEATRVYQD